jgi:hypothetical protein
MRFVRRIPGGGDLIQDVAVMAGDRLEQGDAIAKLGRGSGGHERLKRPETVPGVGGLGDAGRPVANLGNCASAWATLAPAAAAAACCASRGSRAPR